METFANEIQPIYDKLADEASQEIFVNRLVYNLTGHLESLQNVIRSSSGGRKFIDELNQAVVAEWKICIFGTGIWGKSILASYPHIAFYCFVDNDANKCDRRIGGYQLYISMNG